MRLSEYTSGWGWGACDCSSVSLSSRHCTPSLSLCLSVPCLILFRVRVLALFLQQKLFL